MENTKKYLTSREVCSIYNITSRTLLNWCYNGKINFIRTKGNHRRYINPNYKGDSGRYCYCRVSTNSQRKELETQIEYMTKNYPEYEIIHDIGSGKDTSRDGFTMLLDIAVNGGVSELVIPSKDILCTDGFELFEKVISTYSDGKITVLRNTKIAVVDFLE